MKKVVIPALAKVNIFLNVLARRNDGYHDLESIMQSISLHDTVTLTVLSFGPSVLTLTDGGDLPTDTRNLAFAAWLLFKEKFDIRENIAIHIKKRIPVSAGLAGGSSDAAAVLRGARELFGVATDADLFALAAQLGSDVPFCLLGGTALAKGRGEKLLPMPALPKFYFVLVNPGMALATKNVYQLFDKKSWPILSIDNIIEAVRHQDAAGILQFAANGLEAASLELCPFLAEIKAELNLFGLLPLVCGSGPTVMGLTQDEGAALAAMKCLYFKWPFVELAWAKDYSD